MSKLPMPTLTNGDQSNMQTATVDFGLANPSVIEWVLYSEGNWATW